MVISFGAKIAPSTNSRTKNPVKPMNKPIIRLRVLIRVSLSIPPAGYNPLYCLDRNHLPEAFLDSRKRQDYFKFNFAGDGISNEIKGISSTFESAMCLN